MEELSIHKRTLAYMAFSAISSFNVGAYLILLSWSAVQLTSDATLVSGLFLMSLVLGAVAANIAGLFSDGRNTRSLLLWAGSVRAVAGLLLFVALFTQTEVALSLYVFAAIRSLGNAVIVTAGSVAFQDTFAKEERAKRIAELGLIRQGGIAIGTGITGVLIASLGVSTTSLVLAVIALVQTPLVLFFTTKRKVEIVAEEKASFTVLRQRWIDGFDYLRSHPTILSALIVLSATFSVAQLTNVMIPVFVLNDLGASAQVYGALEMSWAIGGSLALIISRARLSSDPSLNVALILLAATGALMTVFAVQRFIWLAVILYAVLGGLFCVVRQIADSRILIETETKMVGRVRAANLLLTNSIGVAIFAIPFVISTERVTGIYIGWGMTLLTTALVARFTLKLRRDKSAPSCENPSSLSKNDRI